MKEESEKDLFQSILFLLSWQTSKTELDQVSYHWLVFSFYIIVLFFPKIANLKVFILFTLLYFVLFYYEHFWISHQQHKLNKLYLEFQHEYGLAFPLLEATKQLSSILSGIAMILSFSMPLLI